MTKKKPEKRRHATVRETTDAVAKGQVVGLLVKRTVTAAVASDTLEQLRRLMGPGADTDARVVPLVEHLAREIARGGSPKKLRAPRRVGEVSPYTSQVRPGGVARFLVIPLTTLGNPVDTDVAFGVDRIIIGRKGEVSAVEVAPRASPEAVLEELRARTGLDVGAKKAGGT